MRSLQRVLLERKTRCFVDEMILKYADIRLASATRELSRKRPRSSVHKCASNQDEEHIEKSTSSGCRTESEQSSTMVDNTTATRHEQGRHEEERWRFSDARTVSVSEYGSAFSSTRLTSLLEEDDDDGVGSREDTVLLRRGSDSGSDASSAQGEEDNQEHHSSYSECDTSSAGFESAPPSTNQAECRSEVSGCQAETESPPTSSSTTTTAPETRLPRLRPTRPGNGVVPNCCDFFTSSHPHYEKEKIGKGDDSSSFQTNFTSSDTTSAAAGDEREGRSDTSTVNDKDDEFEMWDYVCPQYVRQVYRNAWI